jgi:protein-S-isoprenylcysteine O-methyltransferase Ste14
MDPNRSELVRRSMRGSALFMLAMAIALFLPAWTLRYWQAWLFLVVFGILCVAGSLYFIKHDPALVERRLAGGPAREQERSQRIIMTALSVCMVFVYVVPGLDRHFHWSSVPVVLVLLGNLGVVLAFLAIFRVFIENTYASSRVETSAEQQVIATGPYAYVRHPMYSAAVLLFAATPLALGSYWGLLTTIPLLGLLIWRLLDEERVLRRDLPGYADYCQRVRWRLLPGLW